MKWIEDFIPHGEIYVDANCLFNAVAFPNLTTANALKALLDARVTLIFSSVAVEEVAKRFRGIEALQPISFEGLLGVVSELGEVEHLALPPDEAPPEVNAADIPIALGPQLRGRALLTADLPLKRQMLAAGLSAIQPWQVLRAYAQGTGDYAKIGVFQGVPWTESGGFLFARVMPTGIHPDERQCLFEMEGVFRLELRKSPDRWCLVYMGRDGPSVAAQVGVADPVCLNALVNFDGDATRLVLRVMDRYGLVRRQELRWPNCGPPSSDWRISLGHSAVGGHHFNGFYNDIVVRPGWLSERAFRNFANDPDSTPILEADLIP
jgi:hypothetical protein